MFDVLIRNVDAILPGMGRTSCSLAVSHGCIAAILAPEVNAEANEIVNAAGLLALPGVIDPHLHLRTAVRKSTTVAAG